MFRLSFGKRYRAKLAIAKELLNSIHQTDRNHFVDDDDAKWICSMHLSILKSFLYEDTTQARRLISYDDIFEKVEFFIDKGLMESKLAFIQDDQVIEPLIASIRFQFIFGIDYELKASACSLLANLNNLASKNT